MIGATELLIIIFAFAILFFGSEKIIEFAKSLGKAFGEFKKAKIETEKEVKELEKEIKEK